MFGKNPVNDSQLSHSRKVLKEFTIKLTIKQREKKTGILSRLIYQNLGKCASHDN